MPAIKLFELGPTRSARVRWTLLEAALEYESIERGVDIFKSEELRKVHPLGKLPAALIDGQPLFESAAIVTAIADLVPEKALIAKPGTWARNLHYQWVCFALSELEPYVNSTEINSIDFIIPKHQHVPDIIAQNSMMYRKAATALESHFKHHDYLVEDRFSVTDIFVGYTLSWGQEQELLTESPNIEAYMERLLSRAHCTLIRH
ncbi:Glutathione S-transferase family protein [Sulfidibacter corallicola]|uniref:Glutathione S-transferase family protein n=1 Tax=Sulfidibacter corallicola TaxID=2818388 RepID=A0A8A4TQN6_SULCO|nr:glutathione S-transferase family protein [Sulfidibacter corallicola]QTD51870.1 glutathione S-transferase family protein [Sulfidibacter corallicola]